MEEYWRYDFTDRMRGRRTIRVLRGDLCDARECYDVVICSAFKNDYLPVSGSLIGGLLEKREILVEELAREPELDLKAMGCWLSREIPGEFRRIACVELLNWRYRHNELLSVSTTLKSAFSTMRFVLEQAALRGIRVKRVALPILGTGCQALAVSEIAGPLINQCVQALKTVEGLESITFYERSPEKLRELTPVLERIRSGGGSRGYQVFLSYSSRCWEEAVQMRGILEDRGIKCWMAPDSIPAGSSYTREIPVALDQIRVLGLLLTPEAEASAWVHKEVGIAIGNGRKVVPYQPRLYSMGTQFRFLMEGVQICEGWREELSGDRAMNAWADRVCSLLREAG